MKKFFGASGACFFIKADLYHSSGGLDDDFYAHMEEIDLCWRIKNLGHSVMVCPASVVYHVGGCCDILWKSTKKCFETIETI